MGGLGYCSEGGDEREGLGDEVEEYCEEDLVDDVGGDSGEDLGGEAGEGGSERLDDIARIENAGLTSLADSKDIAGVLIHREGEAEHP